MYPFSRHRASTSFWQVALGALLPWLNGCAGSIPEPALLPLPPSSLVMMPECRAAREWSSDGEIDGEIDEEKILTCDSSQGPIFVMAVQQCSVPEKLSYQATTRQLLVGITDLHVTQDDISLGDERVLRSAIKGMVDSEPVLAVTFTRRDGGCIVDLVLWRTAAGSSTPSGSLESFSALATQIASRVKPGELLVQRDSDE